MFKVEWGQIREDGFVWYPSREARDETGGCGGRGSGEETPSLYFEIGVGRPGGWVDWELRTLKNLLHC